MQDERDDRMLIMQIIFGKTNGKIKDEDLKRMHTAQTTWWTGTRKIFASCTEWRRTVEPAFE